MGHTSSLKRTLGLWAVAAPLSSKKPADRYINVLGTFSANKKRNNVSAKCANGLIIGFAYAIIASQKDWVDGVHPAVAGMWSKSRVCSVISKITGCFCFGG